MGEQLVVERDVPGEVARVYAAWTSAAGLGSWWWTHLPDTTYEVDARVGGTYEIRSTSAGIGAQGKFLELDPPFVIRMTWIWLTDGRGEDHGDQVRVDLLPHAGGTHLRLTHDLADEAGDGADLRIGWEQVLSELARSFAAPDAAQPAVSDTPVTERPAG
jgi:uncharacterized protein YndB with AHSA1/START domain